MWTNTHQLVTRIIECHRCGLLTKSASDTEPTESSYKLMVPTSKKRQDPGGDELKSRPPSRRFNGGSKSPSNCRTWMGATCMEGTTLQLSRCVVVTHTHTPVPSVQILTLYTSPTILSSSCSVLQCSCSTNSGSSCTARASSFISVLFCSVLFCDGTVCCCVVWVLFKPNHSSLFLHLCRQTVSEGGSACLALFCMAHWLTALLRACAGFDGTWATWSRSVILDVKASSEVVCSSTGSRPASTSMLPYTSPPSTDPIFY